MIILKKLEWLSMKVNIVNILLQGKSKLGLLIAGFGILLSSFLIASVYQLFNDVSFILDKSEKEEGFQYLQISKEVGVSTSLGLSSPDFSVNEIAGLKKQNFIEDVAELWSNDFRVYGRFAGNGFDMFFTSVKPNFIDADTDDFQWEKGQVEIPVIISNQFLTLLNHAVLPSQGRPPIPKIAIKQATVDLQLTKDGKRLSYKARVVGFSDRISSVLVPRNFLDYANHELSGNTQTRVSMVVLKVKDSGEKTLRRYLDRNDYDVNGEQLVVQKSKTVLKITLGVVFVFGFVILILSMALSLSQIKGLIYQNKDRIRMLILLGYSPTGIIKSLLISIAKLLVVIILLVLPVIWIVFNSVHALMLTYALGLPQLTIGVWLIPIAISMVILSGIFASVKKLIK